MELGIKGHPTRGDEVIKLLESLGGKNCYRLTGDNDKYFYYISYEYKDKDINNSYIGPDETEGYIIFTLEDFLEKFPYKVGDKVEVWKTEEHFAGPRPELYKSEIKSMRWNSGRCEVAYRMKDISGEFYKSDIKGKVEEEKKPEPKFKVGDTVYSTTWQQDVIIQEIFPDGFYKVSDLQCSGWFKTHEDALRKEKITLPIDSHLLTKQFKPYNEKNTNMNIESDLANDDEEQQIDPTIDYVEIVKKSYEEEAGKRAAEITMDTLYKTGITHEYLKERGFNLPEGHHFVDENGNVIEAKEIKLVKNPPYYPKSYEECYDVIGINRHEVEIDLPQPHQQKMFNLFKLLICRDAYWKIAGKHMELDKPWEPDWTNPNIDLYVIINSSYNEIYEGKYEPGSGRRILAFPTIEMQKAFLNNFKDLIEQCKELL